MVIHISPPKHKKRQSKNGTTRQLSEATHSKTRQNWPLDLGAAYQRERGPYTIYNASTVVGEEPLEIFNGWLVWQAMTDAEERRIAATIQEILSLAARAMGFGQAYPDQFECVMVNEDVHKPDVCVISKERYSTQVEPVEPGGKHLVLKGSPELVVEIRSPSNRRTQERKKRRSYFESGALVIWDVDYEKRKIWVYEVTNPDKGQEYIETDEISCAPILGKWKRRVGDFFARDLSAEQVVGEAAKEWRAEALREVVLLQAQARFGKEVPVDLDTRLNRYSFEQLRQIATTLATSPTLEAWLKILPN